MESYSASVSSYARVSRRVVLWRHVLNGGRGERQLFPGLTVSVLAVIAAGGLIRKRSTPPVSDPRQRGLTALYVVLALLAFVLSLGPRLQFDGFSLPGPYGWLIAVVPGMNALRVTARIAILVYLALSVLAAVGASHVLARVRSDRFVAVALGIAVIAEGFSWGVHVVAFDPRGLSQDRLAYEWLRGRPAGGMLELPVLGRRTARSVLKFQFAALAHRHPIVNGYIGYSSALQRFLGGPASPLNDLRHMDETVAALRSLDVRYIALHRRDWPDRQQADATARAIDAVAGQIEDRETFAETSIWQLAAWPAERPGLKDEELVPVATSHLQASAAPAADRIRFAFDGNPDTRWISGRRQRGNERVQIQLDRKRNLERLVLEMDVGTLGDYPRELIVESSSEDGVFRVLFRGPVLRQLIHGLIRDGNHPLIEIDLPSNETLTLRLRQTGEASTWFWSIPELRLLERKGR